MFKYVGIYIVLIVNVCLGQYPNFRIHPSDNNQIEPTIVKHPVNPTLLFCSAYTISGAFRSEGIYVSTDGGLTWVGTDTCSGIPVNTGHGGDPGPIIDKDGMFILTHQGGLFPGMYANYSTNNGATWSTNETIAQNDQDKGSASTNDVSSSSFYGRSFVIWTRFVNPFPAVISYTTNSGVNWSGIIQINNSQPGHQSLAPVTVTGSNGDQYAVWASAITSSPFNEDCVGFATSTNGGATWTPQECAYDCNGVKTSSINPWNIRINGYPSMDVDKTGGARNGWIYIVTGEKNLSPAGSDPDVVFHKSTDGGQSWSPGVRVNQDPLNNGRVQFFPYVVVDGDGGLNVLYYDNRNVADSMDVYLSHSDDGGATWTDHRISNHRFYPKAVSGAGAGNQGDNIGMTYANGNLYPVWMDNSTGKYQTWGAIVDVSAIGINQISSEIPSSIKLMQNYPNPFNPSTKINFSLNKSSKVKLEIFDISGKFVKTLVNSSNLNAGTYSVDFNAGELSSGVYYYSLSIESGVLTKKMVFLK